MPYDPPGSAMNLSAVDLAELGRTRGPAPWRIPLVATEHLRVVLLNMTAGTQTVPHYHPRAEEVFQVVHGTVGLTIGHEAEHLVGPGAVLFAKHGVTHGIRIPGPDSAVLMCIVTPNEDAPDEQVE